MLQCSQRLRQEKEDGPIVRDRKERLPLDARGKRGYRETANQTAYFDMFRVGVRVYFWLFLVYTLYVVCLLKKILDQIMPIHLHSTEYMIHRRRVYQSNTLLAKSDPIT